MSALDKLAEIEREQQSYLATLEKKKTAVKSAAIAELKDRRRKVYSELQSIDKQLAHLTGRTPAPIGSSSTDGPAGGKKRRPRRGGTTLADLCVKYLESCSHLPVTNQEILSGVEAMGWEHTGKTSPTALISQALVNEQKKPDARVVSAGRGKWSLAPDN